MFVGMNEVEIRETDAELGLETSVLYFTVSNQPFAALARRVSFRNLGETALELEVLDGMPAMIPYGTNDGALKNMARTVEAWMEVTQTETRIPFYKLRASSGDSAEVSAIEAGNFALAFSADGERLPVLADPVTVFGYIRLLPRLSLSPPVDWIPFYRPIKFWRDARPAPSSPPNWRLPPLKRRPSTACTAWSPPSR